MNSKSDVKKLDPSYFQLLWPSILNENICDTRIANLKDFFVPKRDFDHLWAHILLASKCFKDYKEPIDINQTDDDFDGDLCDYDTESEEDPDARYKAKICPAQNLEPTIEKNETSENNNVERSQEEKTKIVCEYLFRQTPTYIDNEMSPKEIAKKFTRCYDIKLLSDIHNHGSRVMIIVLVSKASVEEMKKWSKYIAYTQMIFIVRSEKLKRQLLLINKNYDAIVVDLKDDSTWHEELLDALNAGVARANQLNVLQQCDEAFVFIFPSERFKSTSDCFKILRAF